jgi:hypothetical protein
MIRIRKISQETELFFAVKSRRDIKNIKVIPNRHLGNSPLVSKKIAVLAHQEDCTHVAYHRDEDNKGYTEMRHQVQSYLADAQTLGLKCIAIVPMHMTDSFADIAEASDPDVLKGRCPISFGQFFDDMQSFI